MAYPPVTPFFQTTLQKFEFLKLKFLHFLAGFEQGYSLQNKAKNGREPIVAKINQTLRCTIIVTLNVVFAPLDPFEWVYGCTMHLMSQSQKKSVSEN